MVSITDEQFKILKENYNFSQEIKELQIPLTKYEIKELRSLIKKHIGDGYTNYLRVVTVYSIDRDPNLGIFLRTLYNDLLIK
jgi:hypothetical protein